MRAGARSVQALAYCCSICDLYVEVGWSVGVSSCSSGSSDTNSIQRRYITVSIYHAISCASPESSSTRSDAETLRCSRSSFIVFQESHFGTLRSCALTQYSGGCSGVLVQLVDNRTNCLHVFPFLRRRTLLFSCNRSGARGGSGVHISRSKHRRDSGCLHGGQTCL